MPYSQKELKQRKIDALHALYKHVAEVHLDGSVMVRSRDELTTCIREYLGDVVKGQKWRDSLDAWCALIKDLDNDAYWAYSQGGVWFVYDAL